MSEFHLITCRHLHLSSISVIRRKKHNEKSAAFLKDTILKYGDDRVIKYLMRTREG